MTDLVSVTRDGEIAIVTLDNPPVNAMSFRLRKPLEAALAALKDDPSAAAVVLTCAGRTFVSGADITEFGKPEAIASPNLRDLIASLEGFDKPTVAAIHGTAFGGGLELAMGCHFRVAVTSARFGLPEVKLGLLPGAGGTVRLPRLVGASKALKIIVSGNPIGAKEALASGLADAVFEDNLVANAVAFARDQIAKATKLVAVRDREDKIAATRDDIGGLDAEIAEVTKRARGLEAPLRCARSVRNAVTMPFEEAVRAEREAFMDLVMGDQSKAQRHLFFAEREAAKVECVTAETPRRQVSRVGVIGAGTMGGGIAMSFVNGGIPVTLLEMSDEALQRGLGVIEKNYAISVSRGSLSADAMARRMAMFSGTTDYAGLAHCDLVIEAVFEEIAVKKEVFGRLDKVCRPGAILATNTSYLDVNEIAGSTSRPEDVVGLHFFSPANVMKLLEIVRGEKTRTDVLATVLATAKQIGKVPVVVGVCHGFVGNRMLSARSMELEALLLEGATPSQIDAVFTDFGWPMGPFAMGDLAGLDIGWRSRKARGLTAIIADPLCELGRFGQKTGKGYYLYQNGSRTPTPDPEVDALIEAKALERGVNRRDISADEITERTYYPLINEGAKILEEKIASRPSDIDIVWVNGYGFPIGKGGPMHHADLIGLKTIVARLQDWHGKTGRDIFKPSALLKRLADGGHTFADLQRGKT